MTDPVFLRNMVSSSVYAEQINSAQIQGQAAARERATRARQEALKNEQAKTMRLEESAKLDINEDQYRRQSQEDLELEQREAQRAAREQDEHDQDAPEEEAGPAIKHIDYTI